MRLNHRDVTDEEHAANEVKRANEIAAKLAGYTGELCSVCHAMPVWKWGNRVTNYYECPCCGLDWAVTEGW